MKAANTTMEELVADVLRAKGYATSAPFNSTAWQARPVFIQSFEVNSLRRFAEELPGAPLVYLLDNASDPETGSSLSEILSDSSLSEISSFVTVISPWKGLLYTVVDRNGTDRLQSLGLTRRLQGKGFQVHTYTIRDEPQFVLPTCGGLIVCEFEFLFKYEGLNGAFTDHPASLVDWVQQNY
jgi:glycerophosphoryl diester phosphodiesterase